MKLIVPLIMLILCTTIVYGLAEGTLLNLPNCYGTLQAKVYGQNNCYIKNCDKNGLIYSCPCKKNITVVVVAPSPRQCDVTLQYYLSPNNNDERVIPFNVMVNETIKTTNDLLSPIFSIGTFALIALFFIVLLVGGIIFITNYIKKELEEDENRNK